MVKYYNFDIVFSEIPDETTLAINITSCPNRCPGCHSAYLQTDIGQVLDDVELGALIHRYGGAVTCICFMGGDAAPTEIARLAGVVRRINSKLRTAWYSGRDQLPSGVSAQAFDYIKLGPWIAARGPLTSPTTNQRLYRIEANGAMCDITERFRDRHSRAI